MLIFYGYQLYRGLKNRQRIEKLKLKQSWTEEKNRISRELHDNIGVKMSLIRRSLDFIQDNFDHIPKDRMIRQINSLNEISSEVNQSLRDTIWVTKKNYFNAIELSERLSSFIFRLMENETSVKIDLHKQINFPDARFSAKDSLNLIRIVQESSNNALKHGEATLVTCDISDAKDYFQVIITDNGKGIEKEDERKGNGLENMKSRAMESGFELKLSSESGQFTEVYIKIRKR
ncbi:hypothetical protein GCM10007940_41080 [Portibacter lacus]|uniref:histidine kinase n=1 Tax=Portibacter lacus TaxID=1099794 RepID=A0AA37SSW6_9BACT|nr:hypothetical protein GCM10007940_41080 [Portibacter lacus]